MLTHKQVEVWLYIVFSAVIAVFVMAGVRQCTAYTEVITGQVVLIRYHNYSPDKGYSIIYTDASDTGCNRVIHSSNGGTMTVTLADGTTVKMADKFHNFVVIGATCNFTWEWWWLGAVTYVEC